MTTIITPRPHAKRPLVLATAGTFAAMAIVVSVGAWQATHQATGALPQSAPHAAPESPDGAATAAATDHPLTIYLVGSEDQRVFLEAGLDLANIVRVREGPLPSHVINAAVPGADQLARVIAGDAILIRAAGRPAVTLIDLRAP